jgi:hypothetical protein
MMQYFITQKKKLQWNISIIENSLRYGIPEIFEVTTKILGEN